MRQKLEGSNVCFYENRPWREIMSKSTFSLCPRGFGRTSFRRYEALSVCSIPIYIWDDVEWLPYKDVLNWNDFSISINIGDIQDLPKIIYAHTPEVIQEKQQRIMEIYERYFTFEGTCQQIIRMLKEEKT